ncbi:MAG TPA: hypothetical protein VFL38_10705 [Humibacillus xanthopallidus]|nr:hypothetical protein [Humibacillus xanthopallidus]
MLNQLLVSVGDTTHTDAVIDAVQRDGTCWVGGTTWHGLRLIRVSVSNATTTEDDIDRSAVAILRAAEVVGTGAGTGASAGTGHGTGAGIVAAT